MLIYVLCSLHSPYRMSCNSSVIRVHVPSLDQTQRAAVHLLPCEIEHNGSAQVSQYFTATLKDRKHGNADLNNLSIVSD